MSLHKRQTQHSKAQRFSYEGEKPPASIFSGLFTSLNSFISLFPPLKKKKKYSTGAGALLFNFGLKRFPSYAQQLAYHLKGENNVFHLPFSRTNRATSKTLSRTGRVHIFICSIALTPGALWLADVCCIKLDIY